MVDFRESKTKLAENKGYFLGLLLPHTVEPSAQMKILIVNDIDKREKAFALPLIPTTLEKVFQLKDVYLEEDGIVVEIDTVNSTATDGRIYHIFGQSKTQGMQSVFIKRFHSYIYILQPMFSNKTFYSSFNR